MVRLSKSQLRRLQIVPTQDMIQSLVNLEERLPEKSPFIYEFADKLARNLLHFPNQIHVNVLAKLIERILTEYALHPLCSSQTLETTNAARYIFKDLRSILDNVCSPLFAQLVFTKILENKSFMFIINKGSSQTVH